MIVLVQPMLSKRELNADSNYVVCTALIRAILRQEPDWYFIMPWPDAHSGFTYEDDGFFRISHVTRVAQRLSPRKMANAITYDGAWYDQLMRMYGFDVAWCNLVEMAANLVAGDSGGYSPAERIAVVAAHNYVIHKSLPYPMPALRHVLLQQLVGAMGADVNVVNSEHCRRMLLENAGQYLSQASCDELEAKLELINYGTLEPDLPVPDVRNDVPVIAYNHRLQGYKRYVETWDLLNELHDEGLRFRLRVMQNTPDNLARARDLPFAEIKLNATRAGYLRDLAECDLNVTNSVHETFCIAAVESMAFGQPLVAPAGVTFPEITGQRTTGYPYLFRTRDEQKAMLRRLLTDHGERRKWGAILREHVRGHYTQDVWASQYIALFTRLTRGLGDVAPDAEAWVRAHLQRARGTELRAFFNQVANKQVNGRVIYGSQSLPMTKLVRMIRQYGGRLTVANGKTLVYGPAGL